MKTFLFLILLSFNSFAGFVAESKINQCDRSIYSDIGACQSVESESCLKHPEEVSECGIYKIQDVLIDDLSNPIWATRSMVETCSSLEDCKLIHANKVCIDGRSSFYSETDLEVWCNKIVGYEQIVSGKEIVIDESLKAQKDQEKAQELALENAMNQARKAMECGKTVQALLLVRNAPKQLTTTQIKEMVQVYAPIKQLLDTGSLVSAKEEIQAVTADGVLVTNDDKAALVAEIDKCLGL